MSRSPREHFRAILSSLVLIDMIMPRLEPPLGRAQGGQGIPQTDTAPTFNPLSQAADWPKLFMAIATACIEGTPEGTPPNPQGWQAPVHRLATDCPVVLGLSLVPWMLLHFDQPQRGKAALHTWSADYGLQPEIGRILVMIFQLLSQGLLATTATAWEELIRTALMKAEEPGTDLGAIAFALQHLLSVQGQYGLILSAAMHRAAISQVEWADSVTQPKSTQPKSIANLQGAILLTGLLAAVQGGLGSIPLGWRYRALNHLDPQACLDQAPLCQRWQVANEKALWDIADRLLYRWMGGCLSDPPASLQTLPVFQVTSLQYRIPG